MRSSADNPFHRGPASPAPDYVLQRLPLAELSSADLAAWRELSDSAVEPNPFLSPEFVLPAIRHLEAEPERIRLKVLRERFTGRWAMLGVFRSLSPTVKRPLSRLRSYVSRHTFDDTPLVHRLDGEAAPRRFLQEVAQTSDWHGMRFLLIDREGLMARAMLEVGSSEGRCVWYDRVWDRACLDLNQCQSDDLLRECSKSRRKSLQRAYRRLTGRGAVTFRLLRPDPDDSAPLETFLDLEDLGWKHDRGTSLRSREEDFRFIHDVIPRLSADGNVVFGELAVGGRVIASTCNFLSGDTLFAFKVGWDPEFEDGSPGTWSDLLLAEQVHAELPDLRRLDSCASPGSYLESIWRHRRQMAGMSLTWSWYGVALASAREQLRMWKHVLATHQPEWGELTVSGRLNEDGAED